ncbi:MAG: hypothetical protein ACRDH9_02880 [Actinomycetota bacterium]
MSDLEDLAFEQAVRLIEHQRDAVAAVRERVGSLLAGSSIATSFLGATALEQPGDLSAWAWVATSLFGLTVAGSIFVLWARRGWEFGLDPVEILAEGKQADIAEVKLAVTAWMDDYYNRNGAKLDRIIVVFNVAALGLGLEIGAWLGAIVWG